MEFRMLNKLVKGHPLLLKPGQIKSYVSRRIEKNRKETRMAQGDAGTNDPNLRNILYSREDFSIRSVEVDLENIYPDFMRFARTEHKISSKFEGGVDSSEQLLIYSAYCQMGDEKLDIEKDPIAAAEFLVRAIEHPDPSANAMTVMSNVLEGLEDPLLQRIVEDKFRASKIKVTPDLSARLAVLASSLGNKYAQEKIAHITADPQHELYEHYKAYDSVVQQVQLMDEFTGNDGLVTKPKHLPKNLNTPKSNLL